MRFCNDVFFNETLSWHTNDPQLTDCMNDTLLTYLPCLVLWILSPICLHFAPRTTFSPTRRPFTKLFWARVALTAAFMVSTFAEFTFLIAVRREEGRSLCLADILRTICLVTTLSISIYVTCKEAKLSLYTSATLPMFWLALAICNLPRVKMHFQALLDSATAHQQLLSMTVTASFGLGLCLLFLSCSSGQKVQADKSPEYTSSFISGIFYCW